MKACANSAQAWGKLAAELSQRYLTKGNPIDHEQSLKCQDRANELRKEDEARIQKQEADRRERERLLDAKRKKEEADRQEQERLAEMKRIKDAAARQEAERLAEEQRRKAEAERKERERQSLCPTCFDMFYDWLGTSTRDENGKSVLVCSWDCKHKFDEDHKTIVCEQCRQSVRARLALKLMHRFRTFEFCSTTCLETYKKLHLPRVEIDAVYVDDTRKEKILKCYGNGMYIRVELAPYNCDPGSLEVSLYFYYAGGTKYPSFHRGYRTADGQLACTQEVEISDPTRGAARSAFFFIPHEYMIGSGKLKNPVGIYFDCVVRQHGKELCRKDAAGSWTYQENRNCFITTAVVEAIGLANDCQMMQDLRFYRDTWLTQHHPDEIERYYQIAPQVVAEIEMRSDATKIWQDIYDNYLINCHVLIIQNKHEEALSCYRTMTEKLLLTIRA